MMSLSRKLSRLSSAGPGTRPAITDPPASTVDPDDATATVVPESDGWDVFRSALRSKAGREGKRADAARASMELPGERVETTLGPLRRIVTRTPLDATHGGIAHRELLGIDTTGVARFALDDSLAEVDPARMVFLDTETTGLAGGTGTVPFLVGIGRIDGHEWVVEQWFLERFGQEGPILARLAEVLDGASALVTYNGKSFDWPLLRARYVMHRMAVPAVPLHLDLVHGARRVLKDRLASVRLSDVERALLGFVRQDDVDGAEIPGIYLEFQRTGSHPDIPRVVRHHALDLVAMPAMLVHFARHFTGETRPGFAEDRLACARVLARARTDGAARRLAIDLLVDEDDDATAYEAELLLATSATRLGDLPGAREALRRAIGRARDDEARAYATVQLAKHFEHREKDLIAALAEAEKVLAWLGDDAAERRVARLRERLARRKVGRPPRARADSGTLADRDPHE